VVSITKIIAVMSCGVVLCLSLSNTTQAIERMKPDTCADRKGGQPNLLKCDEEIRQGIETVMGDVLRVEGDTYLIQRSNGKEVRLHIDETTEMFGYVGPGERVEVKVNGQKHALSIRLAE
jgi:hypothetical protein